MRFAAWPYALLAVLFGLYLGGYYAISHGMLISTRVPLAGPKNVPSVPVASGAVPSVPVGAIVQLTPYGYQPAVVEVDRGEAIEFRNAGEAHQWPVAEAPGQSAEGVVEPGRSWYAVIGDPGTYGYRDRVYPNATGTVVVR